MVAAVVDVEMELDAVPESLTMMVGGNTPNTVTQVG